MIIQRGLKELSLKIIALGMPGEVRGELQSIEFGSGGTLSIDTRTPEEQDGCYDDLIGNTTRLLAKWQARESGRDTTRAPSYGYRESPPEGYHMTANEVNDIIDQIEVWCPGCNGPATDGIEYSQTRREYGSCTGSLIHGTDNYESCDSEGQGDDEFSCSNCSRNLSPDKFRISTEALITLKELANYAIAKCEQYGEYDENAHRVVVDDSTLRPSFIRAAIAREALETDPYTIHNNRRPLTEDSPRGQMGPEPVMSENEVLISTPQQFLARNKWACRTCNTVNEGIALSCRCGHERYAPVT